jgi:hypothetical protein
MTAEQFVYWLQGYLEIDNPDNIPLNQTKIIKDHLKLVFDKQTPDRTFTPPLAPMPITPYPTWQDPNPFKVTCETSPYTDSGENPMKQIYCSHAVPQHMTGPKEEDTVGPNSLKVINEEKKKFRGGVKC